MQLNQVNPQKAKELVVGIKITLLILRAHSLGNFTNLQRCSFLETPKELVHLPLHLSIFLHGALLERDSFC